MAVVQNVVARVGGGTLDMTWEVLGAPHALSIQVAQDVQFRNAMRHYVIPVVSGINLDVGGGTWFFRVGSWNGTSTEGSIDWTPILGPAVMPVRRLVQQPKPSTLSILHRRPTMGGVRIHIGLIGNTYYVVEYNTDKTCPASSTTYKYIFDNGRGHIDIKGFDPLHLYTTRLSTFSDTKGTLPIDTVKLLEVPVATYGIRALKYEAPIDKNNTIRTTAKGDEPILREAIEKPFLRFASHADYVRFNAAKARSEGRLF